MARQNRSDLEFATEYDAAMHGGPQTRLVEHIAGDDLDAGLDSRLQKFRSPCEATHLVALLQQSSQQPPSHIPCRAREQNH